MTHEKLLLKIDNEDLSFEELNAAIRAVVELHRPLKSNHYFVDDTGICLACTPPSLNYYEAIRYPCPTIQAIEGEID